MFHPISLFIGLRYAYNAKSDSFGRFVSWLSMIGIFLGAFGLIVIMSVMNGFEGQMQNNILRYIPQSQITTNNRQISLNEFPKTLISSDINHSGIETITPLVTTEVILQSHKNISLSTIMGVDPNEYEPIKERIFWGGMENLVAGKYRVILGQFLAESLDVQVGDQIRLILPEVMQITPLGKVPSQRLFTVSGLFSVNQDIDQSLIYINLYDAAKLMKYSPNTITSWRLFLKDPLKIDDIESNPLPNNLHYEDWKKQKGELFQAVKMEKNVMALLISLIVIVAAFNIITSLSLLVMEKQNEVAILKTQGLVRSKIMLIFVIQGASSGILGAVLGCVFGLLVALNLSDVMSFLGLTFSGIQLPSTVDFMQVSILFISLLCLSIISTLYPAYRAANIQPAEALRYE